MSWRAKAFTLIELLAVIAIVSVLAAILFPIFTQAKLRAGQTACASNMRQVGTAVYLYASDNEDALPRVEFPGDIVPLLQPYVKEPNSFRCPNDLLRTDHAGGNVGPSTAFEAFGTSFVFYFANRTLGSLAQSYSSWTLATDTFNSHVGTDWRNESPEKWMVNALGIDLSVRHRTFRSTLRPE